MKTEIKKVKLLEIKPNPDNPRQISRQDMDRLLKSLQEFPEMLQIREIVVDENMVILGGNMRYRALKAQGAKNCEIKQVVGLTEAQKREFIIKDNSAFGQWDFDVLANGWDDLPLVDWGVTLPKEWLLDQEVVNPKPEAERYKLIFDFEKDEASWIQTLLHENCAQNGEEMSGHWRERCLTRLLQR